MASYVFSDIHGHVEPLRRALERINPTESDVFYCLGDMIDRGPSSLATIKTPRASNCTVLMGIMSSLRCKRWTQRQILKLSLCID